MIVLIVAFDAVLAKERIMSKYIFLLKYHVPTNEQIRQQRKTSPHAVFSAREEIGVEI